MLYLFYGKDEFSCDEAVRALQAGGYWPDPSLADFNRSFLDGRKITLGELRHHCDSIPFMAPRRLVIVEGLMSRLDGRSAAGDAEGAPREAEGPRDWLPDLLSYLPNLPATTDLVLFDAGVESRDLRGRLIKWAKERGEGQVIVREFGKKNPQELAAWIKERVTRAGGAIEPAAVARLADSVGDDLRALAQEVDKLLLHAEAGQAINARDVERLVPHTRQANIFVIVDAISERRWQKAISELRRLLEEGEHPLSILAMIVRQYRLIAMAKALAGQRLAPAELARRLGVGEYPAKKAMEQAGRYSEAQILAIYDRLVQTDLAIKTSQMDAPLALELFVAGQEMPRA